MELEALLKRIEEQAVEIADLKKQVAYLQSLVDDFPRQAKQAEKNLLTRMARGAVNCGQHYGCYLAGRYLDDLEKS